MNIWEGVDMTGEIEVFIRNESAIEILDFNENERNTKVYEDVCIS